MAPGGSGSMVNAAKEMRYLNTQERRTKLGTDSQPQLHVDIMYAAIVHAFWPRELNDWTPKAISLAQRMHSRNDLHTHSQVVLQSGAEIAATAKAEKNNKDTSGAVRSDIWCPTAL